MARCEDCGREMLVAPSCAVAGVTIGRRVYDRIPYGGGLDRCGDCGVTRHAVHHPGCDMERCPRCRGQLIMCPCPGKAFGSAVVGPALPRRSP